MSRIASKSFTSGSSHRSYFSRGTMTGIRSCRSAELRQELQFHLEEETDERQQLILRTLLRQLSTSTQSTALLGAFAVLALPLASVGLYGVLSYAVTHRTNEIGVRMALGATSGQILRSFGKRGLALTLAGLAIGLVLATIFSRLMTSLLYGFRPDYIPTVAGVSVILMSVATLACFVPARRASRVDPVIALRNE